MESDNMIRSTGLTQRTENCFIFTWATRPL